MAKYLVVILALVAGAVWSAVLLLPNELLNIVVCDVGQGDAILAYKGEYQMLVDTGVGGSGVLRCLGDHVPFYDRRIEVVMLSHPDADHIGGASAVLASYEVQKVILPFVGKDTETYKDLLRDIRLEGSEVLQVSIGNRLVMDEVAFDIFWPTLEFVSANTVSNQSLALNNVLGLTTIVADTNEYSIGGILSYGEFDMLFSGDADEIILDDQIRTRELREVEVLKVPHHGSKYGMTAEWLSALTPELAIISVGKNNYGHPTTEAMGLLTNIGARILRTDLEGDVWIVSDGQKWWVK